MNLVRKLIKAWPFRGRGRIIALLSLLIGVRGSTVHRNLATGIRNEFNISIFMERLQYFDLYENVLLDLIESSVSPGDTVIDVGANTGYLSAHMARAAGKNGTVHSLEPSAPMFKKLTTFADRANKHGYNVRAHKFAVWDEPGEARITISDSDNIGWISSVDGFMNPSSIVNAEMVERIRLDEYIDKNMDSAPSVIKIDVEGAEYFVLAGLSGLFEGGSRPLIICEIAPSAFKHFGKEPEDLFTYMLGYGYSATDFDGKKIGAADLRGTTNVIFRA
jgi:FkbM family methyltransferase